MKKIAVLILVSFLWCCHKNNALKITELNFSDIDQENIFKNRIQKTIGISGYDSILYKKNDTIEIFEYDHNGHPKKVWRKSFMYSVIEEFAYDSLQLEIQKIHFTDFKAVFNFRYEFDADSLILKKYYVKPSIDINEEDFLKPTGIFKFHNNGKIFEATQYQNNDYGKGKKMTAKYTYDSLNLLASKEVLFESSEENILPKKHTEITSYYYTNHTIDSTVTTFSWLDNKRQKQHFTSKNIYNKKGLIEKKIAMDSLTIYYTHL
ncbi:hypothetical protein KORDIASMS9_03391 [Kordia sp. SMS9]|uniref:hypothetical protein n=1 Tax=Kordia sp. SMS9 TaxID=2282170 RepID=UPI000E0D45D9|nr:hypothetical protein [Kordia sp. SMS9]AXG71136.1 hypothetical protein KORDIASMS9_03391 [Kordia sp. SMS9]